MMGRPTRLLVGLFAVQLAVSFFPPTAWCWFGKKKDQEKPKSHIEAGKLLLEGNPGAPVENENAPAKYGYEAAIDEFEAAIKESTNSAEGYYLLGRACTEFFLWTAGITTGYLPPAIHDEAANCLNQKAEDALLKAVELNPGDVQAHYTLAINYSLRNKIPPAIDQLKQVLLMDAKDKKQLQKDINQFPSTQLLMKLTGTAEYKNMLLSVLGEDAPVELKALDLFNKAVEMINQGTLKGDRVKNGLRFLRAVVDLLPTDCGGQAEQDQLMARKANTCPSVIKYGYQAEFEFARALKGEPEAPILQQLLKMAQNIEMEATYALGKDLIQRQGAPDQESRLEATRAQFQRLVKINPAYKDVQALLDNSDLWVPMQRYQYDLNEAIGRLHYFEGAKDVMNIQRGEVQKDVTQKLLPIQNLSKERQPEGFEALFQEAGKLMDSVSKGYPKVKLQFAVDWTKLPPDLNLRIPTGYPISTKIKHELDEIAVAFTLDEELYLPHGKNAVGVSATFLRSSNDPLTIQVPANSRWQVNGDVRAEPSEYGAFENYDYFERLDQDYRAPRRWEIIGQYIRLSPMSRPETRTDLYIPTLIKITNPEASYVPPEK